MKDSDDTIGSRTRELRLVAQCLSYVYSKQLVFWFFNPNFIVMTIRVCGKTVAMLRRIVPKCVVSVNRWKGFTVIVLCD
jgi:hypothetical protein